MSDKAKGWAPILLAALQAVSLAYAVSIDNRVGRIEGLLFSRGTPMMEAHK